MEAGGSQGLNSSIKSKDRGVLLAVGGPFTSVAGKCLYRQSSQHDNEVRMLRLPVTDSLVKDQ